MDQSTSSTNKNFEELAVLQTFKHIEDKSIKFNLPVQRERARLTNSGAMNKGIERGLLKMAGVLAYNELKMQAGGG